MEGDAGESGVAGDGAGTGSGGSATGGSAGSQSSSGGEQAGQAAGGETTGGVSAGGDTGQAGGSLAGASGSEYGGDGGMGSAGAPTAGGAGGAGGGTQEVAYLCLDNSIYHKLCSAFAAAQCPEGVDCATCVGDMQAEHEPFEVCTACAEQHHAYFQCGIDAFEAGQLQAGVACFEDYGAYLAEACDESLLQAIECDNYRATNDGACPEQWPLPPE